LKDCQETEFGKKLDLSGISLSWRIDSRKPSQILSRLNSRHNKLLFLEGSMSKSIFDRISSAEDLVAKDTKELAGFIMEDLAYDSSPLRWNPDNYASFISPGYKNCNQEEVQRSILEAWYWLVSKGYLVPKGDAGWFVTSRKGASIRVATDLQIQLRQGIREAMEKLVYEETRGNEECYLNFRELANRKGLDDSEIDDVLQHLKGEGLIKDIHNGFTIAITHRLRKKIEQPVDSQKKSHPQTVIYQGFS